MQRMQSCELGMLWALLRPLRWTLAIPLKEGLQIRCAFHGTAEQGQQFLEKAKSLGRIRELDAYDQQRQKQDMVGGSLASEGDGLCWKRIVFFFGKVSEAY